jgi:ABC-type sugar transport system ATPase subunit
MGLVEPAVSLHQTVKRYRPVTVRHGALLVIADKALLRLLGRSGCGKTRLLRMTARLEHLTSGGFLRFGQSVAALPPDLRR